jgi:hypothetical protein
MSSVASCAYVCAQLDSFDRVLALTNAVLDLRFERPLEAQRLLDFAVEAHPVTAACSSLVRPCVCTFTGGQVQVQLNIAMCVYVSPLVYFERIIHTQVQAGTFLKFDAAVRQNRLQDVKRHATLLMQVCSV